MSAKWERDGDTNKGTLTFDIDVDTIKKGIDQAFDKAKKTLTVPGFRKGHIPRQIFNRMYGEEALYQDALNIVLPEAYEAAIKEAGIEPVDQPQLDVDSMEKEQPWVLKAVVTVKPDVKLGEYRGLTVPKQSTRVLVKDIDAELENKRQQQAELVLKEDKAAENGDTVVIDYVGTVDGEKFDGGSADNHSLELGSNSFIPGFEEQLVGHKAGEDVDVKVTFPEDYQAKELAGKEAVFAVKLHEVKAKELPALDDEFAKDVDEDVDSLEELKAKTKEQLKERKEHDAKEAIEEAAISEAVDNAEIKEIPQAMLDDDTNRQMQQYLANMQQQGISPEMYFQITGTKQEDLQKQFAADAENRVKTNLVLEAIVEAEDIKPAKEDIDAEIKDLASQYSMKEEEVSKALSPDMLSHDIAIRKAVDLVRDSAKQEKTAKKSKAKDDAE
ncbi:trigger factor [Paucilactobacillus suebicus]|uniref:Trigger factor n=1 Tax=Paucilactobacillus suebicus DSM 5007 = KCTC 3549 TaxID=1423807 RepID=A0A0R1W4B8_9LACO|nr:trigger factor [Paucilactobacillus suebicus]KRM12503.1 trigger factor [Paucilactobacillus suebicus DSM 5007 = KCTC 3549]